MEEKGGRRWKCDERMDGGGRNEVEVDENEWEWKGIEEP